VKQVVRVTRHPPRRLPQVLGAAVVVAVAPLLLVVLGPYLLYGLALHVAVWLAWHPRGKRVLLVYSDSPVWKARVEQELLPRLAARAVVLNWSQRQQWPRVWLPGLLLAYFGGPREFNPMVVVFPPWRPARAFRFWKAFHDFKHGRTAPVERLEAELLDWLARFEKD
jgi:hypothetical protein